MADPRLLATICARAGSKGVANKNLLSVGGKPLLAHAIESARACSLVEHIVISTDSDAIAELAESLGVPVKFRRPAEFATDAAAKVLAIRHATQFVEDHERFSPDVVVDLDVGVPTRIADDIAGCARLLTTHPDLDGAFTVYEAERNPYFNMVEFETDHLVRLVKHTKLIVRRQDAPDVWSVTPSIFAFRRTSLPTLVHLAEGRWGAYPVPRERGVDIDTEMDLRFVEFLMSRKT